MVKSFPCGLVVTGRSCWVIGATSEGVDKALKLAKAGAEVVVVATNVSSGTKQAFRQAGICLEEREFKLDDLTDQFLVVFEYIEDRVLTEKVAARCREKRIVLSAIDRANLGDVVNVSVFERGSLRLTISTEGVAPALARRIREGLETSLRDVPIEEFLDDLRRLRESVQSISDTTERRNKLRAAVNDVQFEARLSIPKRKPS